MWISPSRITMISPLLPRWWQKTACGCASQTNQNVPDPLIRNNLTTAGRVASSSRQRCQPLLRTLKVERPRLTKSMRKSSNVCDTLPFLLAIICLLMFCYPSWSRYWPTEASWIYHRHNPKPCHDGARYLLARVLPKRTKMSRKQSLETIWRLLDLLLRIGGASHYQEHWKWKDPVQQSQCGSARMYVILFPSCNTLFADVLLPELKSIFTYPSSSRDWNAKRDLRWSRDRKKRYWVTCYL